MVGQLLEYAANAVVYWPVEGLRAKFEARCEAQGRTPEEHLNEFLSGDGSAEAFWQQVKVNLQAGRVRLVFVADEIPSELRRIVEFLNQQMDPAEVLAVEIRQYVSGNLRTLVPSVIGQTAEAQQRKATGIAPRTSRRWDEKSFFQEVRAQVAVAEVRLVEELYRWATDHATYVRWGKGILSGSFTPILEHGGEEYSLFACYTTGHVEVNFDFLRWKAAMKDPAALMALRGRLNNIAGFNIAETDITRRPSVRFEVLTQGAALPEFLGVMDWLVNEIRKWSANSAESVD